MNNAIQPEVHQVERLNVRIHAILNPFLHEYRAHVSVTWDEVEGLISTNLQRKMFRHFSSREDFMRWVDIQTAAGYKKVSWQIMEPSPSTKGAQS